MPNAVRALIIVLLVSIAYIATSVYFYGKSRISDRLHPLSSDCCTLLWLPLVGVNTWAIASGTTVGNSFPAKLLFSIVCAITISVVSVVAFLSIATSLYGL